MAKANLTVAKNAENENFPVASFILARRHRAAVMAFYRFVRKADDIADDPALDANEKIRNLDTLEQALKIGEPRIPEAERLRAANRESGAGLAEALELLKAFRQDAVKSRYADWQELLEYCAFSARPVGRFLLQIHGERDSAKPAADALCDALQILNHLQDIQRDKTSLDRIYLPVSWMDQAGGEDGFFISSNAVERRAVLDAALDRVDALTDCAQALPERIHNKRLRAQSIATLAMAKALSARLRGADPVVKRVELGKADAAIAFMRGLRGWKRQANRDPLLTAAAVRRSGSSFRLGMQSLTAERRSAIHAVYAFCRAVDDIADGAAPRTEKQYFLNQWRREIDRLHRAPQTPIGRELAFASNRFRLPLEECHALLDGMETDSEDKVRLRDDDALNTYGRQVAGSVGALSIHIFGAPHAHDFALDLGRTLQLVNILRDVDEDAARERVYVPLSRLRQLGVPDAPAATLVADPRFARVCQSLAEEARAGFTRADDALTRLDRQTLRPAILMMESYRKILDRLEVRGWGSRNGKLKLSAADRLQLFTLAMRPAL